ncbi:MAG: hypothetical protein IAE82_16730 [Opitutaceae bacterium]|nr:hypothetical protein [Opitutaceae bacterium]
MNKTAHTLIATSIASALALFTALSTVIAGLGSTATITGISLFVAFGMIEIMIQSYAEPSDVLGRMRESRNVPPVADKLVAFETETESGRKAA